MNTCPSCGHTGLKFIERTNDRTRTDHHNHIRQCDNCGYEIIGG